MIQKGPEQQLSASRLNEFLGCPHRAALWLAGEPQTDPGDEALELIRQKGFEHEARVLAALEACHGPAVRIATSGDMDARIAQTASAIRDGAPFIYQAALSSGRWIGFPDFLVRRGSTGGKPAYQPEDAKLAKRAKPEHVLQLGVYAHLHLERGPAL